MLWYLKYNNEQLKYKTGNLTGIYMTIHRTKLEKKNLVNSSFFAIESEAHQKKIFHIQGELYHLIWFLTLVKIISIMGMALKSKLNKVLFVLKLWKLLYKNKKVKTIWISKKKSTHKKYSSNNTFLLSFFLSTNKKYSTNNYFLLSIFGFVLSKWMWTQPFFWQGAMML